MAEAWPGLSPGSVLLVRVCCAETRVQSVGLRGPCAHSGVGVHVGVHVGGHVGGHASLTVVRLTF